MYNSIEIPDSDEEIEARLKNDSATTDVVSATINEHTPEKQRKIMNSSSAISLLSSASTATNSACSPTTSDLGDSPSTSALNGASRAASTSQKKQGRHRSRKTQHQTLRLSPTDIEFETIALDDDMEESTAAKVKKLQQSEPHDNVKSAISNMLDAPEMEEIIQRIAKERVRCNFLLATYQLPDINFNLNTSIRVLKLQFRERLRKRKDNVPTPVNANVMADSTPSTSTMTKVTSPISTKIVEPN